MKLSVCYIVKNEEKNLPLSLETVKDFADELIIVDTGSSDATKKIALDHATGDWIVFLDADEGFLTPEKVRDKISEIDAMRPSIDAVMVTRVNMDPETEKNQGNDRAVRLFRNTPELRYQGRIHENISHAGGQFLLYHDDGSLTVYHTGYAESVGMEKTERNFRLLQQDIAEYGERPERYFELAGCYFDFKDYRKAMKYAILSLDSPIQPVASRVPRFHIAIESMRRIGWPLDEQLALADKALSEYPKQPEFYGERGMILCALGRLEEARKSLYKALEIYENKETPVTAETYFSEESAEIVRARIKEIDALS